MDLSSIDFKEKGLAIKKPRTKTRLNLNYRGYLAKLRTKDGRFYFGKAQGVFRKDLD